MTAFNYTTGNPANLIAGGGASMTDLQGSLNDLRSFLNGGTLDETNVSNLSAAFTTWKSVGVLGSGLINTTAANTYFFPIGTTGGVQTLAGGTSAGWAFYITPTDWQANARTTKLRIRWTLNTNGVAQTGTLTAGLYPVATWGGSSAQAPTVATVGTVVSGSTAVFATPGANSYTITESSEFNAPTAGAYIFGVVASAMAASSQSILTGHVQMRQV